MQSKKIFKRRGQAMVLYALLIPVLFLFVGVGIDLGWYFLNVSRLQNAADAAALAGAQALVEQDDFNNYLVISMASNNLPEDFDDYKDAYTNTFDSNTLANGKLYNYKHIDEIADSLRAGRKSAEEYTRKNLSDATAVNESSNATETLSATDGWSISAKESDKKVSGKIELKYKIIDGKNDVYGPLYYVVKLNETIRHLFMPGWFEPMNAPVTAVVLLKPHYKGLIDPMQELERTKVIDNWEDQNYYQGSRGGKWNHYQDSNVHYTSNSTYRTESVNIKQDNSTGTKANNPNKQAGYKYKSTEVDSLNIDFRAEIKTKFTTDWDLSQGTESVLGYDKSFQNGWTDTNGADKRILFTASFNEAFVTRDPTKIADPLWVRIESDPIKSLKYIPGKANHTSYNSVRQITLNFNDDNTTVESDHYKYRPYVIFYTGPENIDYAVDPVTKVLIRHSQPVVLNLNENLNAIVYMPNSPVIINGNGNAMHGFVIAKCFLKSVTAEDMLGNTSITLYDGFNAASTFQCSYTEGTDGDSNTVYFKPDDLLDRNEIDQNYSTDDVTITEDGSGNVVVYEKLKVNNYILLNYTKADHDQYAVTENGKLNENKTFAAYVNATYKAKYKTVSGLNDSQITAVSFPDENHNETTATYYVDSNYVSTSKVNDNYVKVLVNGSTMYADKTKLPYVKVRTNKEFFYVSVSDLRLMSMSSNSKGVRMIDNSYTDEQILASYEDTNVKNKAPEYKNLDNSATYSDADIYLNPDTTYSYAKYGDSWRIPTTVYNNWKNWKKDKVEFSADGSYFMLKSEIAALPTEPQVIATYRKITYTDGGEEKVKYAKVGDKLYYTKVYNNETNHNNYIIVDENGNMLTKPVTAPEVLTVDTEEKNNAVESYANSTLGYYYNTYTRKPKDPEEIPGDYKENIVDGKYRGNSEYRKYEDYRIPALERVYYKNVFNLSGDSYYSYFDIDELWRVNYTYLNVDEFNHTVNRQPSNESSRYKWKVDDMFFTTLRAAWID